jgi:hypothetical protein
MRQKNLNTGRFECTDSHCNDKVEFRISKEKKRRHQAFAESKGLSLSQFYILLGDWRCNREDKSQEIDLTLEKKKWIHPKGEANGLKRYLKVFGTEQQQKILNKGEQNAM